MTDYERRMVMADTLRLIAEELLKGAAGPCDYWYKQLAERLLERERELR